MGASVFGGICNNSGGALIHRGPAYTQMALFARIDDTGEVQFVNYLGVRLGNESAGRSGRTPGGGETHLGGETERTGQDSFGREIIFNDRTSIIYCVIKNISSTGSKLVLADTLRVPNEIELYIPKNDCSYHARLIRSDSQGIGVDARSPGYFLEIISEPETNWTGTLFRLMCCGENHQSSSLSTVWFLPASIGLHLALLRRPQTA